MNQQQYFLINHKINLCYIDQVIFSSDVKKDIFLLSILFMDHFGLKMFLFACVRVVESLLTIMQR